MGLEEVLIPLHVETVNMLINIHRATSRDEDVTPRLLIEAWIHARHHQLFNSDVPINSVEDAKELVGVSLRGEADN